MVSPHEYLIGVKGEGDYNYINANTKMGIHYISISSNLDKIKVDGIHLHLQKVNYVNVLTKRYNGSFGYESVKKIDTVTREAFSIDQEGSFYNLVTDSARQIQWYIRDFNPNDQDYDDYNGQHLDFLMNI